MKNHYPFSSLIFLLALSSCSVHKSENPTIDKANVAAIYSSSATAQPIQAKHAMVASQEAIATQVGIDILKKGGNAVDAAVAVGYALAVTLPKAGNIGGGGFMLVHLNQAQQNIAIDYRETAPSKAHKDLFLDANGNVDHKLSTSHGLAVGVPGTVAGLELARKKYGTMSRKELMTPAIKLAEEGITVSHDLAASLAGIKSRISKWPSSAAIFYQADGSNFQEGDIIKQSKLAESLKLIRTYGNEGFYQGKTAQRIVSAINDAGGIMSLDDLKNYQAIERNPVSGSYRGYEVISMPPPSSGGVHLIQMLNILEHFAIGNLGHNTAENLHLITESMKLAYADRSKYLGDPDFYSVPVSALTDKNYAKKLAQTISRKQTKLSKNILPGHQFVSKESPQTTHYSVVDKWGNAVSNTYTLNYSYGSGLVAKGTGILLNNEMDDFSAKANTPNSYGLVGGEANAVEGNKRPLSSMTPTIVLKDNQPFLVTGSPGGSRIITTTLQMVMNTIDHKLNIAEATAAPRIHHQWLPDELRVERSLNLDTIKLLQQKGHSVAIKNAMGSTQSIMKHGNEWQGSSDPRRSGSLTAGY